MKVHQIMTARPRCIGPDNTLVEAAGLMRELDVGGLPICEDERLAGMVTDRDIVVRGTAEGCDPNSTPVRDVMSLGIIAVSADQEVEEAARLMEEKQVRRLPVLDRARRLVGIVALGDLAISSNPAFSGMALRDVSQPSHPNARQRRLSAQSEFTRAPQLGSDGTSERKQPRGSNRRRATSAKAKSTRSSRTTGRRKQSPGAPKTTGRHPQRRTRARTRASS